MTRASEICAASHLGHVSKQVVPRSPVPTMRSPAEFRRILIIGEGGFGREVLQWATVTWQSDVQKIAGFLSADSDRLDGHSTPLALGTEFLSFIDSPSKSAVCPLERMKLSAPLLQTHRHAFAPAEQLAAQAKPRIPAPKVADDVAGFVAAVFHATGGRHG